MKGRPVANSHYVRQPMGIVLADCLRGLAERLAQQVVARFRCNRDELIRVFGLQDRVIAVVVFRPAGTATLLASVEPRSTPDGCVLVSPPRHRPARPGGAVFNTASPVALLGEPGALGVEHRSTLASSVVAWTIDPLGRRSGSEHRSTEASSAVAFNAPLARSIGWPTLWWLASPGEPEAAPSR
jgi:hypothetical protein